MNQINRASCKTIRDQLNAELKAVGEKLGLTIHAGNASFTDTSVTFKVECILEGVDKGKENFERDCFLFDIPKSTYKSEFGFQGRRWILEGLKPRSPKYPIIASKVGENGNYKLPERAIQDLKSVAA